MGNVIAFKKGAKTPEKSVLLTAHMDEVGLIITGYTDDGYLKFDEAGGLDRRVIMGKTVTIGPNRVFGVIGTRAVHLISGDERDKIPPMREMFIDIGVKDRVSAAERIALGDTAVFGGEPMELAGRLIKARALDDRVGCAIMMKLLETDLPIDCTFAFTVQEEVGNRGAFAATFSVDPDIALVIETATSADLPSVSPPPASLGWGRGL